MDSSRTVKRRAGTWPRRWLGIVLSLVLALGTLGLIAPAAHAEGAVVGITKAITVSYTHLTLPTSDLV